MTEYDGNLRLHGEPDQPMNVIIDLTGDRMKVMAGGVEVADWARDELRVRALADGFHVRAEGEEVVLDVREDARFAIELGLKSAHPLLRRRMAALMRDDG